MAVLMIFWDGVGYGKEDPLVNPFFAAELPTFRTLFGGVLPSPRNRKIFSARASVTPVNTTLGVSGLPQSGTGQTAIFTGVNAPKKIGKHFGPHPYSTLVPIIKEKNIFVRLQNHRKKVFFVNGFPKRYFDYINSPRGKTPVVALSYLASGGMLNTIDDIAAGRALSADCTNEGLNTFGYHLPVLTPFDAGKRFYKIGCEFDFTLFEYFFSDKAGHSQTMKTAVDVLERIDSFLGGILHSFKDDHDILLFISDHGNIEDLSTKSHTRNPVPLIVVGNQRKFFSEKISKLTDVTPAIESFITR
jgi:2,3-bisphosphoglycerate-independent phosphoglycerate mutase